MSTISLPKTRSRLTDLLIAESAAAFTLSHGRFPGPGEPELYAWLERKRRAARKGRLRPRLDAFLGENMPGWRLSREDLWNASLKDLAASEAPTARQRAWLASQCRAARNGTLTARRRSALDTALGKWEKPAAPQPPSWEERADDITDFVDLHGRLPSASGRDDEASLARWITHQRARARAGHLLPRQMARLDRDAAGWLPASEGRDFPWQARAKALTVFVDTAGRWPKPSVPAEADLAKWARAQRTAHRNGKLTEARSELLAGIPGWPDAVTGGGKL